MQASNPNPVQYVTLLSRQTAPTDATVTAPHMLTDRHMTRRAYTELFLILYGVYSYTGCHLLFGFKVRDLRRNQETERERGSENIVTRCGDL
jgi:hypothetical protein